MKRPRHTSMEQVSRTGKPAPSWTFDEELTRLANECFIACVSEYARPDLIKVYRNDPTMCYGRCFFAQRIITIDRKHSEPLRTLAHEIAHLRVRAHCPSHERLTEDLHIWLLFRTEGR